MTTCSITMEIMTVTKAIVWLESQTFIHGFFLIDLLSMHTGRLKQARRRDSGWNW
uniref:Uncharacterized protein n=1 Tax=Arion vulgaris TaxID=1028688 RepID=A0A0B7A8Y6_9EUPU